MSEQYDGFDELARVTKCPFAKKARVVYGPDWCADLALEQNALRCANALEKFGARIEDERLHGLVVKVGTASVNPSFEEVRSAFGEFLFALGATEVSCGKCMTSDFLDLDWQFSHSGTRYFLNVFASCYTPPHSKHAYVQRGFYVFFQPERSFDFCAGSSRKDVKLKIREQFARSGMPYDGTQIDRRIEALLYMFPLEPFGDPVVWWCGTDGDRFTIPPLKAELLEDNDTDASSFGLGPPID